MSIVSWFLPSLVALFIWGLTAFLPKLLVRNMLPLHMIVYNCFFFFLTASAVQLLFLGDFQFEAKGAALAMATGACGTLGQVCYLEALRRGPLTYVSMISSLYPGVATLLAFILLPDAITLRQGIGVLLGLASIITLVVASDHPGKPAQPKPVNDQ